MARPSSSVIDGIVTLLSEEVTLGTVYARHAVADLAVPSVTVEAATAVPRSESEMVAASENIIPWDVVLTVRLHTGYSGGVEDADSAATLGDTLITKLRTNVGAISGCRILDVAADYQQTFSASATTGVEFRVTVLSHEHYEQEI